MKRFHVHVAVADLAQSIEFYSTFFDTPPSVQKEDYAKWMLDDPRINFAISKRGREPGLDHLGIQVESPDDLKEISVRLKTAQQPILEQEQTNCCYAKSDKTYYNGIWRGLPVRARTEARRLAPHRPQRKAVA